MSRIAPMVAALLLTCGAAQAEPAEMCRSTSRLVGACFAVHGRLSAWNGTPTFRIQPSGTKRILGVDAADGDPEHALPPSLEALVKPDAFKVDLDGDFLVCPFAPDRPGHMRFVCIADASSLKVHRRE